MADERSINCFRGSFALLRIRMMKSILIPVGECKAFYLSLHIDSKKTKCQQYLKKEN